MANFVSFDDTLRARIVDHLTRHDRRAHPLDGRKHAAVAVVLVDSDPDDHRHDPHSHDPTSASPQPPPGVTGRGAPMVDVAGGAAFLLCRRAPRLNSHASQWALPGGRIDPGESPLDAARRETHEELGLSLDSSSVLGMLDDYPTRSGYVITPVVMWGGADVTVVPSPDEVIAAYRVGLHALCGQEPLYHDIPESDRPVVQLPLGEGYVYAPTGAVLLQFRRVALEGQIGERVDHLEQPVFAWN